MLFILFIVLNVWAIRFLNKTRLPYGMSLARAITKPGYYIGVYNVQGLKIGPMPPFDAEVEISKPGPISSSKPTAFVAGHAYEKQLGDYPVDKVIYKAQELGSILGTIYTIITGHCTGVPSYAANAALEQGAGVIGLSPFSSRAQHWQRWSTSKIYTNTKYQIDPGDSATIAIHTGLGLWHRDVCNLDLTNNHRQHAYVVGGYEGSYHEVTVAIAKNAIVGALLGVGGISGDIESVIALYEKHNIRHDIVMDTDPKALVEKVTKLDRKLREETSEELSPLTTPLKQLLNTLEGKLSSYKDKD